MDEEEEPDWDCVSVSSGGGGEGSSFGGGEEVLVLLVGRDIVGR